MIAMYDLSQVLDRYRVTCAAEREGKTRDPVYRQIRSRAGGTVCPWGPTTLAFTCTKHRAAKRTLIAMGCQLVQEGDQEWTVTFPADRLDEVHKVVKLFVRRHLNPEQRATATERLRNLRRSVPVDGT